MKTKITSLFVALLITFSGFSQTFQYSPIASVDGGITTWLVTNAQLSSYLTAQMNQNLGIDGNINSSTILEIGGTWWAEGTGEGPNTDDTRNIRILLAMDDDGKLTFDFVNGGSVETCTGNPCEKCEFAAGGGCTCTRTSTSQSGVDGKCDHSISRPGSLPPSSGF